MRTFPLVLLAFAGLLGWATAADDSLWSEMNGLKGQWNFNYSVTTTSDKSVFHTRNCTKQDIYGACHQPLLSPAAGDKIRVTFSAKNTTLRTLKNLQFEQAIVVLCFPGNWTVDKGWKKFKNVIRKDKSCPFTVAETNNLAGGTFEYKLGDNIPTTAVYFRLLVKCLTETGGEKYCQYENFESKGYLGIQRIPSVTHNLRVAVGICAAVGPLFLIGYFAADMYQRKQK